MMQGGFYRKNVQRIVFKFRLSGLSDEDETVEN